MADATHNPSVDDIPVARFSGRFLAELRGEAVDFAAATGGPPQFGAGTARRIDHVAIAVRDADIAARWYVEQLGLRIVADEAVEDAGVRLVYLASGGADGKHTALQLVQPVTPGSVETFVRDHGEGLHHICFTVDDIPQTLRALDQTDAIPFRGGRGKRACFLLTRPNNTLIELTETAPVSDPLPWRRHALADGQSGDRWTNIAHRR